MYVCIRFTGIISFHGRLPSWIAAKFPFWENEKKIWTAIKSVLPLARIKLTTTSEKVYDIIDLAH